MSQGQVSFRSMRFNASEAALGCYGDCPRRLPTRRQARPIEPSFLTVPRPRYAKAACGQLPSLTSTLDEGVGVIGFAELVASGPYFDVTGFLDASSLCPLDASCAAYAKLNKSRLGAWCDLGNHNFHGLALECDGAFGDGCLDGRRRLHAKMDWKARYCHFAREIPSFCAPFGGQYIGYVANPDEVIYLNCILCTDALEAPGARGVYLEVEILANADNVSMAVVDFAAGGCGSITFSPDTGAVIHERKTGDDPRQVYGSYVQPLPRVPSGRRFHGRMGFYLSDGRIAFFRRCSPETFAGGLAEGGAFGEGKPGEEQGEGAPGHDGESGAGGAPERCVLAPSAEAPWESTGFVSGVAWAEGRLTPCLAFRDEGPYQVRVVRVGREPPIQPQVTDKPGASSS